MAFGHLLFKTSLYLCDQAFLPAFNFILGIENVATLSVALFLKFADFTPKIDLRLKVSRKSSLSLECLNLGNNLVD